MERLERGAASVKYVVAQSEDNARNNAPDYVYLPTLANVRTLPKTPGLEIYCVAGWSQNRALAGLIGLAAARGYILTGRP